MLGQPATVVGVPSRGRLRGLGPACSLVLILIGARARGADQPAELPVVLVVPVENQTRHHAAIPEKAAFGADPDKPGRPAAEVDPGEPPPPEPTVDRLSESARSLLEDLLMEDAGITVVERRRVDAVLGGEVAGKKSGPVADTREAVRLGKRLDADMIVLGSVVDIRDETRSFRGYGVAAVTTEVVCSVRIRLVSVATGTVQYSKLLRGSKVYAASNFGGSGSGDRRFAALEATLQKLKQDSTFRAVLLGGTPRGAAAEEMVEIGFTPVPARCEIEIDGKLIGTSPLTRVLSSAKEYKVRVSKGGYKPWETTLIPESGLRITRELERNP